MHSYTLGTDQLESSSAENHLVILVENMLNTKQQVIFANQVSSILDCSRKSTVNKLREVNLPLSTGQATSEVLGLVLNSSFTQKLLIY